MNSIHNIRFLEDLARKETYIHRIHPLIKLLTTVMYLFVVVSFNRYDIGGLMPLLLYPVYILIFAELPIGALCKRVLWVEPFIIGIGILNPLFDHQVYMLGNIMISRGWITCLSIFIKGGFTVMAAFLLIATTGMDHLAYALRKLKVPRLFVLQLLLTYRYISVLMEEVSRTVRAYTLRSPRQKGIHRNHWGSLAGQLLLRTYGRAQRVYQAMCLRGFDGEYHVGAYRKIKGRDILYLLVWVSFFLVVRFYNIPLLIGTILTGVIV